MLTRMLGAIGLSAALMAATPALAADAYTSFNAVNGNGGFYYGTTDGATIANTSLFGASAGACVIAGTTCLQRGTPSSTGDYLPGVYKNANGAFQFGTVSVPGTSLVLHPGPAANGVAGSNLESVFVAFVASTAATYNYKALFTAVDDNPSGVGVSSATLIAGSPTVTFLHSLAATEGANYMASGSIALNAGDALAFIIDKGGAFYYDDSTSLSFQISAAPEPATWGLMILGFGIAGAGLRRSRRQQAVAAA